MKKVFKAIIFDLGNVIVPFDFKRGYTAMELLCPYAASEIPKRIRTTDLVQRFETGQIASKSFVKELCRLLELPVSHEQFCDLWTSVFLPHTLIPESLLANLARQYRLVLLSNTNEIHFQMIRRNYPLLDHFDHFVLSYEVGALKPSRRIYEEAVARAGCRPDECFFIDDVELFVEGARQAGLEAVRFENYSQLETELRRQSILDSFG
jgi:glucose-1-phosphatase